MSESIHNEATEATRNAGDAPRVERWTVGVWRAVAGAGVRALRPVVHVTGIGEATERMAIEVFDRALASHRIEDAVDRALASGVANRVADRVVNSPDMDLLVARLIESRLMDEAVARLLESEDLWLLVDEVARSPSVTEAISHQGVGFAEQMAALVRERSRRADARLEHTARRWAHRRADGTGEPAPER